MRRVDGTTNVQLLKDSFALPKLPAPLLPQRLLPAGLSAVILGLLDSTSGETRRQASLDGRKTSLVRTERQRRGQY